MQKLISYEEFKLSENLSSEPDLLNEGKFTDFFKSIFNKSAEKPIYITPEQAKEYQILFCKSFISNIYKLRIKGNIITKMRMNPSEVLKNVQSELESVLLKDNEFILSDKSSRYEKSSFRRSYKEKENETSLLDLIQKCLSRIEKIVSKKIQEQIDQKYSLRKIHPRYIKDNDIYMLYNKKLTDYYNQLFTSETNERTPFEKLAVDIIEYVKNQHGISMERMYIKKQEED